MEFLQGGTGAKSPILRPGTQQTEVHIGLTAMSRIESLLCASRSATATLAPAMSLALRPQRSCPRFITSSKMDCARGAIPGFESLERTDVMNICTETWMYAKGTIALRHMIEHYEGEHDVPCSSPLSLASPVQ